jgi:hypothetical protein
MKYLKKFENHSQYVTFTGTSEFILPNVSICVTEEDVHYNPYVLPKAIIIAKFKPKNTFFETRIASDISNFTSIEIDGVVQPSVTTGYTFSTISEHTVKYTLKNQATIGYYTFSGCTNLIDITIPNSVKDINTYTFKDCTGLTRVNSNIDGVCNIPNSVTSIGNSVFYSCSGLTSINIPNSVTDIGLSAFTNCGNLTSCTIGNNITTINDCTFKDCTGLTRVNSNIDGVCNIPNSVTSIYYSAFERCKGFTSVVIPDSVTSIGTSVFNSCSSITSITSNAVTAPSIQAGTFYNIKTGGTLYVPVGSSGYDTWMQNVSNYLGYYEWTKVEQ